LNEEVKKDDEHDSDTDDYDEFYNDKSFLNTNLAKNTGQRGTHQAAFDPNNVDT
jgi:hypothetical protein